MPQEIAYLSIGSNLGQRRQNVRRAIARLSQDPGITVERISSFYETSPVGFRQPAYLNIILKIKTSHSPHRLLAFLKGIERSLGRKPGPRWRPRPADLDIIFYGHRRLHSPRLTIPHEQFRFRRFVLVPLLEIAPRLKDPQSGKTIRQILRDLTSPDQRVRLKTPWTK